MDNIIRDDFEKNFRNTKPDLSPVPGRNDYVVTRPGISKALLVRLEYPFTDIDPLLHVRIPAPHCNAETTVYFRFMPDDSVYLPDIIVFGYGNQVSGRTDFLIFRMEKLPDLLDRIPVSQDFDGLCRLLFWILPGNRIFLANNISAEGEWYLLGSGLWEGSERDFSEYLNRWRYLF